MVFSSVFKKNSLFMPLPLIGMDIQLPNVWIVAYHPGQKRHCIDHFVVSGKGLDEWLSQLKRQWPLLVARQAWRGRSVAIALPHTILSQQLMRLPAAMSDGERRIEIEKRLLLGELKEDMALEIAEVGKPVAGFKQIVVATAERKRLKECVTSFENAGWTLKIVDLAVYALVRAVKHVCRWRVPQFNLGVIVYVRGGECIVVGFVEECVLFQSVYREEEVVRLVEFIIQTVRQVVKAYQLEGVHRLVVCGEKVTLEIENWSIAYCEHPFIDEHELMSSQGVDALSRFWIAYGLTLRTPPQW